MEPADLGQQRVDGPPSFAELIELLCAETLLDLRLREAVRETRAETNAERRPEDGSVDVAELVLRQSEARRARIRGWINERIVGARRPEPEPEPSPLEVAVRRMENRTPNVAKTVRGWLQESTLQEETKIAVLERFVQCAPTMDVVGTLRHLALQCASGDGPILAPLPGTQEACSWKDGCGLPPMV